MSVLTCERQCQYCPTDPERAKIWGDSTSLRRHVREVHVNFRIEHNITMPDAHAQTRRNGTVTQVQTALYAASGSQQVPEMWSLRLPPVSRRGWNYYDPAVSTHYKDGDVYQPEPMHAMVEGALVDGYCGGGGGGTCTATEEMVYTKEDVPQGFCHRFRVNKGTHKVRERAKKQKTQKTQKK